MGEEKVSLVRLTCVFCARRNPFFACLARRISGFCYLRGKPFFIDENDKLILVDYKTDYLENGNEIKSMRMIPEGFQLEDSEKTNNMERFVPMSIHATLNEMTVFYDRLGKLFEERESLPVEALKKIQESKQEEPFFAPEDLEVLDKKIKTGERLPEEILEITSESGKFENVTGLWFYYSEDYNIYYRKSEAYEIELYYDSNLSLDESVKKFESGMKLSKYCNEIDSAIEKIS